MNHQVFDAGAVVAHVRRFCACRHLEDGVTFTVVGNIDEAIRIVDFTGVGNRFASLEKSCAPFDVPDHRAPPDPPTADRLLFEFLDRRDRLRPLWFLSKLLVSADYWARFSAAMRAARDLGLGWIVSARREVLVVPRPVLRFAEGRPGVFHDDTGRKAIEWPDGTGYYLLQGTEFDESLYHRVIGGRLLIQEIAALSDVDQRSIALSYMTFEQLVVDSDSDLIDTGVKGTRLYRLPLPPRIARDRRPGYGRYDYFIHMRDASHPDREFVEWVDPTVARHRNAELCQAHAFGITLDEWLSIEQEG